jgi:GNAT superfamily N-acetyltransferase
MARLSDADAIAKQNVFLAEESEKLTLKYEIVRKGVHALLSDKRKGFYIVAEENGSIIGQLMITVEWSDWRNKPIWWVQSVYVQKAWRKKGVFTQLLQYIQQRASEQGVAFLRLYAHEQNIHALRVYEKVGWERQPYVIYQFPL